ncbi:peptidase, M48 family [Leptospira yanagawae serovar Saopaulo str. Sao Paulo = ATCC 700523]|uniref:Peptidase, M48 family n=1 Tax=Leptospira yanagawae serovar Saopaulo str. Sao Paulo = ATCC 700523 TaxID=1249483 RepID=A0A5E8HE29_9LEPT|nr:M48 family metallopeptidase [Leptospira yanagawae]EOQ89721.1 peptidase, M48 family [Leptospira yanagawae serovar Saopaulo str. Sao Paulo = ATCC 700523]
MFQNQTFTSRYFNGVSAVPEEGTVLIHGQTVQFTSSDTNHKISLSQFTEFIRTHNGCKLVLLPDERKESPTLEIFCTKEESKLLEKIWIQNKKSQSHSSALFYSIREMNPLVLGVLSLLVVSIVGFFYFKGLEIVTNFIPLSMDKSLGDSVQVKMETGFNACDSKATDRFFAEALKQIVPKDSKHQFTVSVLASEIPNAFALSNGKIYFFSGLLNEAKSQEEVLGVLAHEIAHIEKRHHMRNLVKAGGTSLAISLVIGPGLGNMEFLETITEIGSTILVLKFSRDFETEADITSLDYLKSKNISTDGLLSFFKRMEELENGDNESEDNEVAISAKEESSTANQITDFLSTHPATKERMKTLESLIQKGKKGSVKKIVSDKTWKEVQSTCLDLKNSDSK